MDIRGENLDIFENKLDTRFNLIEMCKEVVKMSDEIDYLKMENYKLREQNNILSKGLNDLVEADRYRLRNLLMILNIGGEYGK